MDVSNSEIRPDGEPSLESIDPEEQQKMEEELRAELAKTEEEIATLRQVLAARLKHSNELKKKLGLGVWKELTNDLQQSIKNVQETTAYVIDKFYSVVGGFNTRPLSLTFATNRNISANRINELYQNNNNSTTNDNNNDFDTSNNSTVSTESSGLGLFNSPYQKTSETVRFAAEKTTDIFGSLGDSIGRKLVDVKNSNAFKSFEEKVGSTIGKTGLSNLSTSSSNNNNNEQTPTANLPTPEEKE